MPAPVAVAGALAPFRERFAGANVALCMVVVVAAVAANGHRLAGALAALSCTVWFDFFFTKPYESFTITRSADVQMAVLLLLVGLVVSEIAARARRLQVVAITDADHLARIRDTAEAARSSTSPAPDPPSKPAWSRSPSPTRRAAPSSTPRTEPGSAVDHLHAGDFPRSAAVGDPDRGGRGRGRTTATSTGREPFAARAPDAGAR
ncbi:DUF4118 domain-containing protein [Embleya sp. NPDC055664]